MLLKYAGVETTLISEVDVLAVKMCLFIFPISTALDSIVPLCYILYVKCHSVKVSYAFYIVSKSLPALRTVPG